MAAKAFAASDDGDGKTKVAPGNNRPAPLVNCQCVETGKFPDQNKGGMAAPQTMAVRRIIRSAT